MGALRNIGHQIAISVRRLLKSPRSSQKMRFENDFVGVVGIEEAELNTPDSMRSVSFTEAITWPFIDDDLDDVEIG